MTDFNFIYHRRQTHTGVINGALWGAHDRRIREQRRSRVLTTMNHGITYIRSAA